MTGGAAPAFDLDTVVVRAIGRLPLIESVADERTADLTVGTDRWAGEAPRFIMHVVALDVGTEVYYNEHVVEPDAKDPAAKRVFASGFSFHSLMGSKHTGLPPVHQSKRPPTMDGLTADAAAHHHSMRPAAPQSLSFNSAPNIIVWTRALVG